MRITNKVLVKDFLGNLRVNLEQMQKYQDQLSSGHEVRKPSDDPFKVARTMELKASIAANERYKSNIEEAMDWLNVADSALGQIGEALQTIREKTIQGGNGAYTQEERLAIAKHIQQLKEQIMEIGNTAYDGRYIFGGDKTNNPPFKIIDGKIVYVGSKESLNKELSPGVVMDISAKGSDFANQPRRNIVGSIDIENWKGKKITINGQTINLESDYENKEKLVEDINNKLSNTSLKNKVSFNLVGSGVEIVVNTTEEIKIEKDSTDVSDLSNLADNDIAQKEGGIFATLSKIIDKLNNNGNPSDLLGELDTHMNNILRIRAEVGAKQKRTEDMLAKNEDETFNMTQLLSKTYDVDIAKKVMEYKVMENIYNASLQTGAKILQPSLLDFLR